LSSPALSPSYGREWDEDTLPNLTVPGAVHPQLDSVTRLRLQRNASTISE
jgi:hypothetical protein